VLGGGGRLVAVEIGVVAVVNPFFSDTVNDKTAGTQSTHIMAGFLLSHPLPRAMDEEAVVGNLESVVPCVLQCDAPCDPNPDRGLRTVDTEMRGAYTLRRRANEVYDLGCGMNNQQMQVDW